MADTGDAKSKARQKREQAHQAAQAAQKRNRNIQIAAGVLFAAVAVVLAIVVIGNSDPGNGGIGDGGDDVTGVAETQTLLDGIPQNEFVLGQEDAPVTVYELVDLQCPFCRIATLDEHPKIFQDVVRSGEAKFHMVPLGFLGPDSVDARATLANFAVKDRAFNFANLFYWNQGEENSGYVTDEFLDQIATAAGGSAEDVSRNPSGEAAALIEQSDKLQSELSEQPSTPLYFVGRSGAPLSTYTEVQPSETTADDVIEAVRSVETGSTPRPSAGGGAQSTASATPAASTSPTPAASGTPAATPAASDSTTP